MDLMTYLAWRLQVLRQEERADVGPLTDATQRRRGAIAELQHVLAALQVEA